MPGPESITHRLESAFTRILRDRMHDVPILNPGLRVEAVGFQEWDNTWTGVLITPWFMNLMQLPRSIEDWSWQWPGQTLGRELPAGRFEFISASEEETGPYLACSLFSPMQNFADHHTAVATAKAVIAAVMTPAGQNPDASPRSLSRRHFLLGPSR